MRHKWRFWAAGAPVATGVVVSQRQPVMPLEPSAHHPTASCAVVEQSLDASQPTAGEALFRAVLVAGSELGELTPELSGCRTLTERHSLPAGMVGAYVPLLGSAAGFHVGILADVCSCELLTGALNRAREPREPGVRAALSELADELGLRVVRRLDPTLRLTLGRPLFVDGLARRTRAARLRAAEVAFGNIRATLALVGLEALRGSDWPGKDATWTQHEEDR